jgi:hypothetical protein
MCRAIIAGKDILPENERRGDAETAVHFGVLEDARVGAVIRRYAAPGSVWPTVTVAAVPS